MFVHLTTQQTERGKCSTQSYYLFHKALIASQSEKIALTQAQLEGAALGTRIDAQEKMATGKCVRPAEGFYRETKENI